MLRLALFCLALAACGTEDPTDATATEVAAGSYVQHWSATGNATPAGCSPAFADMTAATNTCTSVPAERNGCSVGCFGSGGSVTVAVGCHGCSAEYRVTFTPQ